MRLGVVLVAVVVLSVVGPTINVAAESTTKQSSNMSYETITAASIEVGVETEKEYLDKMENLTERFDVNSRPHAFFLTDGDRRWMVFSDTKPQTGRATVRGTIVIPSRYGQIGAIFADSVSVSTDGERTSIQDIRDNPSKYDGKLVEVTGTYRQVSYLIDGSEFGTKFEVAGSLGGKPNSLISNPGSAGRWGVTALSKAEDPWNTAAGRARKGTQTRLTTIAQGDTRYWINAQTTVDAVVLENQGAPALIVAKTDVQAKKLNSPSDITDRGAQLEGDVVSVRTQVVGAKISSQEFLLSTAKCAPESVTVPGAGCMPVPTDVMVHGGVLFDGVPQKSSDVVFYAGVSNHHQQQVLAPEQGTYQVTGRVVSTNQIDSNLPDGYGLIVYEMERVDGPNAKDATRQAAEQYSSQVVSELRAQVNGSVNQSTADGASQSANSGPANVFIASRKIVKSPIDDTTGQVRVVLKNTGGKVGKVRVELMTGKTHPNPKFVRSYKVKPGERKVLTYEVRLEGSHTGTRIWVNGHDLGMLERNLPDTSTPVKEPEPSGPFGNYSGVAGFSFGVGSAIAWLAAVGLELLRWVKSLRGHKVKTSDLPGAVLVASGTILGSLSLFSYGESLMASVFSGFVFGLGALFYTIQWIYTRV